LTQNTQLSNLGEVLVSNLNTNTAVAWISEKANSSMLTNIIIKSIQNQINSANTSPSPWLKPPWANT
jgi:hypothetical protein